jgi:hypothetical protein
MGILSFSLLAISCAGCASGGGVDVPTAAPTPQEVRALVLAERTRAWKDSESIRDARISQSYSCLGWTARVCIEANGKNSLGGYTGLKQNVANISGRTNVNFRERGIAGQCTAMEPFPELNGGYVPTLAPRRDDNSRRTHGEDVGFLG